jgi:hypothetical protein
MQRILAVICVAMLGIILNSAVNAADCRRCALEASVQSCADCVVRLQQGWSLADRTKWCTRNQPVCYRKTPNR